MLDAALQETSDNEDGATATASQAEDASKAMNLMETPNPTEPTWHRQSCTGYIRKM